MRRAGWIVFWLFIVVFVGMCALLILGPPTLRTAVVELPGTWPVRAVSCLVAYLGEIFRTLFPWPAVVLILGALFIFSSNSFAFLLGLTRLVRKIKILGAEIDLTEAERSQIRGAASELEETIAAYRKFARATIEAKVRERDIERRLRLFIGSNMGSFFKDGKEPEKFRCTIHISDVAMQGYLYQLLDYYPHGSGAGRPFSQRYGIIGKVWRSGRAQIVGNLIPGAERGSIPEEATTKIVETWGMTEDEALKVRERRSYACYPIVKDERRLGLLYMDSTAEDAFSNADNDPGEIDRNCRIVANWEVVNDLKTLIDGLTHEKLGLPER